MFWLKVLSSSILQKKILMLIWNVSMKIIIKMSKVRATTAPIQNYNPNRILKKGIKQLIPIHKQRNPIKANPLFF